MEQILSTANSGLAVVVVIGLCLFFHELGHFVSAKACGMAVYEFAMGFGPVLWRRQRGETVYALRAIPFGGFVRIAGMEPGEANVERGLHSKPRWMALIVFVAGTFMNVVLAVILYWGINVISGIAIPDSQAVMVKDVFPKSPAEAGGVLPGDKVIGVGGGSRSTQILAVEAGGLGAQMGLKVGSRIFQIGDEPTAAPSDVLRCLKTPQKAGAKVWLINGDAKGIEDAMVPVPLPAPDALAALPAPPEGAGGDAAAAKALGLKFEALDQFAIQRYISARPGKPTMVTVLRKDQAVQVRVTPGTEMARVEVVDAGGKITTPHRPVGRIGIAMGPETRRAGVLEGLNLALRQSESAVAMVVVSFKAMILGKIGAEPTGPIGIMAMSAETAKLGWASVLALCALISANLAVVNMFPIPPFDGFHVALLGIEAALRRRVDHRLEMIVRIAGVVIILNLFLLLAYKDIMNLVKYHTY
jgi:regulator of sigma E protease